MKGAKRIITAIGICLGIILGGTIGYMLLEDYTFFQGFYMSAITISTVGYGEVKPLSPKGQAFSIILIFTSILGLALAGRALGETLLAEAWSGQAKRQKMQSKIKSLKGHYLICGYGRVGLAAATQFSAAKAPYVVIDQVLPPDPKEAESDIIFIEGDATREQTLLDSGIKQAKGLLALLGSDPENVFLVLTARELNPTLRIIARANDPSVESRLHKAGTDTVISPFTTAGIQVANEMLLSTGQKHEFHIPTETATKPHWYVINADSSLAGATISDAVGQLGVPVLGIRRQKKDHLMPSDHEILNVGDALLTIMDPSQNNQMEFEVKEPRKLVIIDDNPVIVKLYTRLFRKAGFIPYTAANGAEGLDLIYRLKPAAAVIDFMLPTLSGIEICKKIRANQNLDATRLILFTADNNIATRRRALSAGVDAVVVKSPDAHEVIETVTRILSENDD